MTMDPKHQKLHELVEAIKTGVALPRPLWVCSGCGAQIFYQDDPGKGCPQCKRPRPS